jgi:integrase/recombinase XerD
MQLYGTNFQFSFVKRLAMEESVSAFLDHITHQRQLSANTRAAYQNDLSQLTRFFRDQGVEDWKADRAWVSAYARDLLDRGYSASTRARKVAAVRSFYRYLCEQGVVAEDPTQDLGSAHVERVAPTVLTRAQVDTLFAAAEEKASPEALRDQSILRLLYSTGIRITEALGIDLADVDQESLHVLLRSRNKESVVPIDEVCLSALERYVADSRPQLQTSRSGEALFLNHRGQRLTRQGFWLILKGYARAARLPEVTPQTLRHTFAAHALEGSVPLQRVRSMLGHASMSSTQRYAQLAETPTEAQPESDDAQD